MNPLSDAELAHLSAFMGRRPEWTAITLAERIYDECEGGRNHKYPLPHPYITGMHFVLERMRGFAPCNVVDIGSPLSQNIALAFMAGVEVEVLDVRPHPWSNDLGLRWRQGTATALPYADGTLDIVTSMWVMGHVGDGRYGDEFEADGDLKMLAEVARVLRPGGTAIIGPGLIGDSCGLIFNVHRIYTWDWLNAAFDRAGLDVLERREFPVTNEVYFERDGERASVLRKDGIYGAAVLRKR